MKSFSKNQKKKSGRARRSGYVGQSAVGGMGVSNNRIGIMSRDLPLFPEKKRARLKYYDEVSFTGSASNLVAAYVLSANGIFDCDVTGTGHQPTGFDQMMTFYNHYTVLRSRIQVVFNNTLVSTPIRAGLLVSGSTTVTTDYRAVVENGAAEFCQLSPSGVSGFGCTLKANVDAGRFQAVDDVMDDPNMRGDAASNPTEQAYYHLMIWNTQTTTAPTAILAFMVEYDVVFHEPRKAAISVSRVHEECQLSEGFTQVSIEDPPAEEKSTVQTVYGHLNSILGAQKNRTANAPALMKPLTMVVQDRKFSH